MDCVKTIETASPIDECQAGGPTICANANIRALQDRLLSTPNDQLGELVDKVVHRLRVDRLDKVLEDLDAGATAVVIEVAESMPFAAVARLAGAAHQALGASAPNVRIELSAR